MPNEPGEYTDSHVLVVDSTLFPHLGGYGVEWQLLRLS